VTVAAVAAVSGVVDLLRRDGALTVLTLTAGPKRGYPTSLLDCDNAKRLWDAVLELNT
jgi:hypothetical protein